jgi:hypothetical protein
MGSLYTARLGVEEGMRPRWLLALLFLAPVAHAEEDYYRLKVTRDETNIYTVDNTRMVIQTSLCLEIAFHESAILIWDYPGSRNNKLAFLDYSGKTKRICQVKRVMAEINP